LSAASQEDVEEIVKPLGFFRSKATNLRAMAAGLVEHHGGEVPADLEALVVLAGVGRKTASVVLGTWFGIPSGVVVDTHVRRLTNLLGLVKSQNAEIIERELMELVPQSEWINFSHRLIHHGRRTCVARRPQCGGCGLLSLCQRVGLPALDEPEDAV
jgi:endonuclease-3